MWEEQKKFCEELASISTDIRTLLDEHVKENDELLPHILMADITHYILSDGRDRRRVVQLIEDSFRNSGTETHNLIAASLLENIGSEAELKLALRDINGRDLLAGWIRQQQSQ